MSGVPNNVTFEVYNTGSSTVKLDTIAFFRSDTTACCETLLFSGRKKWDWQNVVRARDTAKMGFDAEDSVLGSARARVDLRAFKVTPMSPPDSAKDMHGDSLRLKFSDGSFIDLRIP
jgi:hypothetical protein